MRTGFIPNNFSQDAHNYDYLFQLHLSPLSCSIYKIYVCHSQAASRCGCQTLFIISISVLIISQMKPRFQHCSKLCSNFFPAYLTCQCFIVLGESNQSSCCLQVQLEMLCIFLCITAGFIKGGIQNQLAVTVTINFSFRNFSIKIWHIHSRKPTVQWSEVTSCSRIWSNCSSQGRNYIDIFFGNKSYFFLRFFFSVCWGFFPQFISVTLLIPLPLRAQDQLKG